MKVLFAAKDAILCFLFGMTLRGEGYAAEEALSDTQAWAALGRGSIDVCVLDLDLPAAGGLALLRRMRAEPEFASIPVLLLSGRTPDRAGLAEFYSAGANDWMRKPVEPYTFLMRIGLLAGKHVVQ